MHWSRSRASSYIAAGLLSLLVLVTFYLLRFYGPAWAIRRFHEGVLKNDASEVAAVSLQRPFTREMVQLETIVRSSQSFDIAAVTQGPQEAVFDIRYYLRGKRLDVNWVVDLTEAGWVIDAHRTIEQSPELAPLASFRLSLAVTSGHFFVAPTVFG